MQDKTLSNTTASQAKDNVTDLQVWGDGNKFKLICKASSQLEGWMKSTKAMQMPTGVVIQVTTQQRNTDGSNAVAEALTYVPGVFIFEKKDKDGNVTERGFSPFQIVEE